MGAHERPGPTVALDEARRWLFDSLRPLEPVLTPIDETLGRVVAAPVEAPADVPHFANSAMDGFAVRAADTSDAPVRLTVIGTSSAGGPFTGEVGPGQAVAIATGGALPDGADSVCMIERSRRDGNEVVIEVPIELGGFVRPAGDDIARGSVVFEAGTAIGPAHVGVLASLGLTEVETFPPVRVGVLATGNELVETPGVLGPGQIHETNRHALLAAVRRAGGVPVDLGIARDDESEIGDVLEAAVGSVDVILTSGGVSVGEADHLKAVLTRLSGGAAQWMEMRIKPGKPFGFAKLAPSGLPVLSLPGNPVSALVVFELIARPALRLLAGHREPVRAALTARAMQPMARPADGKVHYVRVAVFVNADGTLEVQPSGGQGSHQLRALAAADGLAVLATEAGVVAGDQVRVLLLDPDGLTTSDVRVSTGVNR